MFGTRHRLNVLEETLRIELRGKDRQIEQLQQELKETRSWGRKWRDKAKFLRKARKELTDKLHELTS